MKFSTLLLSTILATAPLASNAQKSSFNSPITQAMMKVYDQTIENNPRDYDTLFKRASEYYKHDAYNEALQDVNNALRYMPSDDHALRYQALMLRANIYDMSHRYNEAVSDLNSVLSLAPGNYTATYLRANANFELGNLEQSKKDYQALYKQNPRSQEALFGLARIAVKENNLGVADELSNRAVELTPQVSDVYLRRASIRSLAGNIQGAVDDYILAISTDNRNNPRALNELVNLSKTNYPMVMSGLTNAIRQAPKVGMFYYIRAMIAQSHCSYASAIADYDKIINDHLYSYPGLNAALAECYYALGKYDTALLNADYAISATDDNVPYYVLKSNILRAMKQPQEALECAEKALEKNPDAPLALRAKALAQVDLKQYTEASVSLSEALLTDPTDAYNLMLRAWIMQDFRKDKAMAEQLYQRVLELDYDFDNVHSLKGFALLFLGRETEAENWMTTLLDRVDDYDGLINYYAACFYAQKGSKDLALKHTAVSLEKGYANYHNWMDDNAARINVAPIRSDKRFKETLDRYAILFK